MTTIIVDYSELNSARREARDVARETENHSDFLKNKIKNKLMGITGNNITDAVASVNKKINTLDKKTIKFSELSNKIQNYKSIVETKDEQVARVITKVTDAFASKNGIKVNWIAKAITKFVLDAVNDSALGRLVKDALNRITTVLERVKDAIKHSLKMGIGKYLKDIVLSIGAIAAGVVAVLSGGLTIVGIAAIVGGIIAIANGINNIGTSIVAIGHLKNGDPAWARKYGKLDKVSDSFRSTNYKLLHGIAGVLDLAEITTDVIGGIDGIGGLVVKGKGKLVDKFKSIKNLFENRKGIVPEKLLTYDSNKRILVDPRKFMDGLKSIKGDKQFIKGLKDNGKLFIKEMKEMGVKGGITFIKENISGKFDINNIEKLDDIKKGIIGSKIDLGKEIINIGNISIKNKDILETTIKIGNLKDTISFIDEIKTPNGDTDFKKLLFNSSEVGESINKIKEMEKSFKKIPQIKFK